MNIVNVTAEEKRLARKEKFKKKAPKKPKMSSSHDVWKRYVERYNDWAKEVKAKAKAYRDKEALIKKVR